MIGFYSNDRFGFMIIFTYNPQIRNYAPNMIQKRKEPVGTGAEQDDTAGSGHAGHYAEQL